MSAPISLYVHIPWCIQKCPYCDFNSHQKNELFNESRYVDCLLSDMAHDVERFQRTSIHSIFIGGGTPSLFSPQAYDKLFSGLQKLLSWQEDTEITLEANPGTFDQSRFIDYRALGINRLSIGVQSFQNTQLKKLGRIHDSAAAIASIEAAHKANFQHINIDLMYGLPEQTITDALDDLKTGLALQTDHLSWYELTIEPNTLFYKRPPKCPDEATMLAIEDEGRALIAQHGFSRYEISAYGKNEARSEHNLNYWRFGDYYGIGAGAHSKITASNGSVIRCSKKRQPSSYMAAEHHFVAEETKIDSPHALIFEFMLNQARLLEPITFQHFENQTGLKPTSLFENLEKARALGLIYLNEQGFQLTPTGIRFSNEFVQLFLTEA
jgi:putative oxygen-independent coproporphyrinogen III oxidase